MIDFSEALKAWGAPEFKAVFKKAVEKMGVKQLPLQQGMSFSDYALDNNIGVSLLSTLELGDVIHVKAGIFYEGMIAGCNCADDPTPADTQTEYCEVLFVINKNSGQASVILSE